MVRLVDSQAASPQVQQGLSRVNSVLDVLRLVKSQSGTKCTGDLDPQSILRNVEAVKNNGCPWSRDQGAQGCEEGAQETWKEPRKSDGSEFHDQTKPDRCRKSPNTSWRNQNT